MSKDLPFFDPQKARGGSDRPDVGEDVTGELVPGAGRGPLSVSALIARIKNALGKAFPGTVTVIGELSNVKLHTSGHLYFRLKDAEASIDAAMFRQYASRLKFTPEDGLEVVVEGRIDVYDVRGQLQIYAERMSPRGTGALELAFRQLREKLQGEGLFDASRKKPIPRFPRAVGIITSATGAAIRDIRRTLARRFCGTPVYLIPVLVQGEGSAEQIANAIALMDANAQRFDIDTIIIARGGGSLEDLWAFNEEIVARAIFAGVTPIISGVGHEVDVTIADLVADLRAPTPTGAGELAVPDADEIRSRIALLHSRVRRMIDEELRSAAAALNAIQRSVAFRDPAWRIRTQMQRVDELTHRLRAAAQDYHARSAQHLHLAANRLAALHPARLAEQARGRLDRQIHRLAWVLGGRCKRSGDELGALTERLAGVHPRNALNLSRQRVAGIAHQLDAMSYRNVLNRGFSVTRSARTGILRSVEQVARGQEIETELRDGKFRSLVNGGNPPEKTADPGKKKGKRRGRPKQQNLFE